MSREDPVEALLERIRGRTARIAVVGLGHAGLPLAVAFAVAGHTVRGYDRDAARVASLRRGELPFGESEPGLGAALREAMGNALSVSSDAEVLPGSDVLIAAVDTPIDAAHAPDVRNLLQAIDAIAAAAAPGSLLIVESTVAPGTMRKLSDRLRERSSDASQVPLLAYCPERVRPGRMLWNLRNLRRVVGADDPRARSIAVELYGAVVDAPIDQVDLATAEIVKTGENFARDAQIAIANQLAIVSDRHGADVRVVRDLVNVLWSGEPLVLMPGLGVGGPCLPKDPWLLVGGLPPEDSTLVDGVRRMNDHMVDHALGLCVRVLACAGGELHGADVALLGTAYKADADDERWSRGLGLARALEENGATVRLHDPHVPGRSGPLEQVVRDADLLVVAVAHTAYRELDPAPLVARMRKAAVLDCPGAWADARLERVSAYARIGSGVRCRVPSV